jgi:hypothetical protein
MGLARISAIFARSSRLSVSIVVLFLGYGRCALTSLGTASVMAIENMIV